MTSQALAHPVVAMGLTLKLGGGTVLRGLDWTVPAGTATGLIGPNGSGKSTLIHAAMGLLVPSAGQCLTLGQEACRLDDEHKGRLGFVDQKYRLLDWVSVEQQIRFVAKLQPRWDSALEARLIDAFQLGHQTRKAVEHLPQGERQRLAVLVALCHRPDLLLLDEPVSAQDPIFRAVVLEEIQRRVIEDGATVVLSSHVLRDIESCVDRLTMVENGRVTTDEELDTLKEQHQRWTLVGAPDELAFDEPYILNVERKAGAMTLLVRAGEEERRTLEKRHGVRIEARHLGIDALFPLLLNAQAAAPSDRPAEVQR